MQSPDVLEYIAVTLAIVVAGIPAIVYLARLEKSNDKKIAELEAKIEFCRALVLEAQKDVDVLRTKHEGLDNKIVEQLAQVRESLARLEGRLGIKNEGE
jgi:negative regulator of sigma E activity